jgi:ParB family transcriptional regulator, chromosome partitioning protein
MEKKARLGRGLDALLSTPGPFSTKSNEVALDQIEQNPYQPRRTFDPDELSSLCASIRAHGVLQPLVVRAVGDHYQLIAGERRLRAAKAAGLPAVPVRVVDFDDQQVLWILTTSRFWKPHSSRTFSGPISIPSRRPSGSRSTSTALA